MLDSIEQLRLLAREVIGEWLIQQEPQHFELVPVAYTPAEKQALCDKQVAEEREGEVWVNTTTPYIGGKVKAEKSGIIRTKYQIEFQAVITDLTPSTNASYPFGAIVVSKPARNEAGRHDRHGLRSADDAPYRRSPQESTRGRGHQGSDSALD